jgi:CBS domain-containing protein
MPVLKVRDLMTSHVISVRPTTPIREVARLLIDHRISGMPVIDESGGVIGVVSEGDLVAKEQDPESLERRPLARIFGDSLETRAELSRLLALTAGDAMTAPAITIASDALIAEAATAMTRRRVKRLPVVDGEKLVGVITRADIVRAFARPDDELAHAISEDVLYRTIWLDPDAFDVHVADGKVRIRGRVERRSEADMIERFASLVPGVVSVSSDVTWRLDDGDPRFDERDFEPRPKI